MKAGDPKRPSIAVASVCIGEAYRKKEWVVRAELNHRAYCLKHGYSYSLLTASRTDRVANWERYPLILDLFDKGFDIVMWTDMDSIFTNFSIRIEDLLSDNKDLSFASGNGNIINTGHFILRNTPWSRELLNGVYSIYPTEPHLPIVDNGAFAVWLAGGRAQHSYAEKAKFYRKADRGARDRTWLERFRAGDGLELVDPVLRSHVQMLPKRKLNSYISDYRRGDYVLHLAGTHDNIRNRFITKLVRADGTHNASLYTYALLFARRNIRRLLLAPFVFRDHR